MQRSPRQSENSGARFLRLCNDVSLKRLEEFYVYNKVTDELYEIDEKASGFLCSCNGHDAVTVLEDDSEFVDYCINEKILDDLISPGNKKEIKVHSSKLNPSLRYLELLVTDKCNLKCRHCYLNNAGNTDLAIDKIEKICNQFEELGGLRLMVSGGEPLLHKEFDRINDMVGNYGFRAILLTNGTLLNKYIINDLSFNEVQLSLDGLKESHDFIRGAGSFDKTLKSATLLREKGVDVSIATMISKKNIDGLEELNKLVDSLNVKRWEVDVPCALSDEDIFVDYERAGKAFKYGYSSGLYNSAGDYACGAHLMTVMNDGKVSKCSFFADKPVGSISDGLSSNFVKLKKIRLDELECDCEFLEECRGGCRYRAYLNGGINKKDIAKCGFYLQSTNI
jgi:radical SAM protein with 4Fe4S-binding SPASM domain